MYSGTTFNHKSGNLVGVHQKIDRAARTQLKEHLVKKQFFPGIRNILHFEGKNGPDAIKRKSPAKDEPWHYIDPSDPNDKGLYELLNDHRHNLIEALRNKDQHRAAFEAAWLSHAIVDGLTPAHHYPLEEKLEELRGEGLHTRTSYRKKLVIPGETRRERVKNNWEFWGARGVMTTHLLFELGIASAITPMPKDKVVITEHDQTYLKKNGFPKVFEEHLSTVVRLHMYETFRKRGWTPGLARQTRRELIPLITQTVTLAWLDAANNSIER